MAFIAQRREGGNQKVVFELQIPKDNAESDKHRYLIPRLSQLDVLEAQKIRAKLIDDEQRDVTTGSSVLSGLIERVEPIDGAKKLGVVLRELENDNFNIDPILEEVTRLASTDIATLLAENQEVRG